MKSEAFGHVGMFGRRLFAASATTKTSSGPAAPPALRSRLPRTARPPRIHGPVVQKQRQDQSVGVALETGGVRSEDLQRTRPPVKASNAAVDKSGGSSNLWELVTYNTSLFNPQKLPAILVSVAKTTRGERENEQLSAYLQRARNAVEHDVEPVRMIGASGVVACLAAARRLDIEEGKAFATALSSALTAEIAQLPAQALADLAQELWRLRLVDTHVWKALAAAVVVARDIGPVQLVALLDAFRRALSLGQKNDDVFKSLSHCASRIGQQLSPKQLVGAIGSLSRLGHHISPTDQRKAIQILLDQWLSCHATGWDGVAEQQVVSIAVSLTNVSEALGIKVDHFLNEVATWAPRTAAAGTLMAEDLVVLLWTLKQLTPLGLRPYRELVVSALPRLHAESQADTYSLLRLVQASEVLLASRHAVGTLDMDLVKVIAQALTQRVAGECSPEMLARVVALWDQLGDEFWEQIPDLADAIVGKALTHVEDGAIRAAVLRPMLDTLALSSFAQTRAFAIGRGALFGAVASRHDATDHGFTVALRNLGDKEASSSESGLDKSQSMQPHTAEKQFDDNTARTVSAVPPLPPAMLAQRLGKLCQERRPDREVVPVAESFLHVVDQLKPAEIVPALEEILSGGRGRLAKTPILVDIVERLGDGIVAHAPSLPTLQLTAALNRFASVGLPYHLLFEVILITVIEQHRAYGLSWGQVVGVLEAFAAVRLNIQQLEQLYSHLRRPQELARLPTMGLIRFSSAASRLDLVDADSADMREIVDRVLAETTPSKPLPLETSVVLIQSLLLSGTVLPDKQLRHVFAWVAETRTQQLTPQQLSVLRQYSLFLLSHPDAYVRGSLLRLPVEVQRFASGLLRHRAPSWNPGTSDTTRRFRMEVTKCVVDGSLSTHKEPEPLSLGPGGTVDLVLGSQCWLLDGPEAFFRPFSTTSGLRHTPSERQRASVLGRLLSDPDARKCVANFLPAAAEWPVVEAPVRLNWLEWGHTPWTKRSSFFCIEQEGNG